MKPNTLTKLALVGAGTGLAAFGIYKSTHPSDARIVERSNRRTDDDLFDLPPGIVDHVIPTRDGGTIHAIEKGQGRPLVLLHGITLRADVWAPQFHDLVDRFRVIAVDLRGHGDSKAGSGGFGLTHLGDDVADLLEALDLRDAIVVGHSMGGMTLMTFCVEHPDTLAQRVAGLVFLDTCAHQVFPPGIDKPLRKLVGRGSDMVAAGRPLPGGGSAPVGLARLAFGGRPDGRAVRIVAEMGASMDQADFLASADQMFDHDTREGLRQVTTPSMVVVGTRDLLTPVPASRRIARLIPGSELVVLPGAGHQLMQERPAELADLLEGFADKLDRA